jgi:hypothetical protein
MSVDEKNIWLTRLAMPIIRHSPLPSAPTIIFTLGMVPAVLFLTFYYLIIETATIEFFYLMGLATLIGVIGPYFLYRYDTVVFPKFINRVKIVTPDDDNKQINRIGMKYKSFFVNKYYYIVLPWTLLGLATMRINISYFKKLGVESYADPIFIPYLLLVVIGGIVTGIGLHMALTTVLCIREVGNLNFTIDPLHPDGLGGLSAVGYFAISSTTLFSIGSLGLPFAFDIASSSGLTLIVYFLVIVYIGTVVFSFVYPTLYINRRAKKIRREMLKDKRKQIRLFHEKIMNAKEETDVGLLETKLATLRNEYDEYENVNLYPMSPSILSKLISSIMLPLLFLLIETYVVN